MEEGEVAERKRRGRNAVDEHQDAVIDHDAEDDVLDDADSGDVPSAAARGAANGRRGATAVKERPRADRARAKTDDQGVNAVGRVRRFVREIVAELNKVIWPTRNELITYAVVVVVFVSVIVALVAGLDSGFAWLVLHVFGNGKK